MSLGVRPWLCLITSILQFQVGAFRNRTGQNERERRTLSNRARQCQLDLIRIDVERCQRRRTAGRQLRIESQYDPPTIGGIYFARHRGGGCSVLDCQHVGVNALDLVRRIGSIAELPVSAFDMDGLIDHSHCLPASWRFGECEQDGVVVNFDFRQRHGLRAQLDPEPLRWLANTSGLAYLAVQIRMMQLDPVAAGRWHGLFVKRLIELNR